MPSGTGAPAPSSSRPRITIAPGSSRETSSGVTTSRRSPMLRYGPTVCDGDRPGDTLVIVRLLERCRQPAAEHDVEAEAQCPVGLRQVDVEATDKALTSPLVADRVEDR